MNEYPQPPAPQAQQPKVSQATTAPATSAELPPTKPLLPPPAMNDPQVKRANRNAIMAGVIVAVLLALLTIVAIYLLLQDPLRTANIRDIVIILTAIVLMFMSIVIGVLLVVLIYRIQELTHFLRAELVPLIVQVSQTVRSVSGTTRLVSDNIAKPTIKVASFMAGVQQMAKSVNTKVTGQGGSSQRPTSAASSATGTATGPGPSTGNGAGSSSQPT